MLSFRPACAAALLSLFVASASLAQSPKASHPAPAPKKQPTKVTAPDKTVDKPAKQEGGYPEIVKKELYAEVDVRGKQSPAFKVEKWLTSEPERKGKTVLIDYWATWCGPCKKLMPELSAWQKEFKDDLVVIGISDEKPDVVSAFLKKSPVDYAIATDTHGSMKSALRVKGIPHVLVISSDGVVRWQGLTGLEPDTLTSEKLKAIIDADKASRNKGGGTPEKKPDPKKAPTPTKK